MSLLLVSTVFRFSICHSITPARRIFCPDGKKSFTLVQVYSSPFYAPTWGADSSHRAQCIGHCGAAPTPSCFFSLRLFEMDWSQWQAQRKGAPSAWSALDLYGALMLLYYALYDGQAKAAATAITGASAVSAIEALENVRQVVGRDTDACVAHFDYSEALIGSER